MEGEAAAALALFGGAVALAASILLLENGTDDSNQDGMPAENILSFVNVAHRPQNQGTGKQRRKNYNHECRLCFDVEEDCWLGHYLMTSSTSEYFILS
jgi:hypothetical protein